MQTITEKRYSVPDKKATHFTIKLIGRAIKEGSTYIPIRNYAAALATEARPKDYLGQLKNVWRDIHKRWRYVRDPVDTELVTTSPRAVYNLILGHHGGVGRGLGAGDCDDIVVGLGAALRSIGFPIRLVTIAPQNSKTFNHIFIETEIPGHGEIVIDPVLYPQMGLGDIAPHSQMAVWDLDGRLLDKKGDSNLLKAFGFGKTEKGKKKWSSLICANSA